MTQRSTYQIQVRFFIVITVQNISHSSFHDYVCISRCENEQNVVLLYSDVFGMKEYSLKIFQSNDFFFSRIKCSKVLQVFLNTISQKNYLMLITAIFLIGTFESFHLLHLKSENQMVSLFYFSVKPFRPKCNVVKSEDQITCI